MARLIEGGTVATYRNRQEADSAIEAIWVEVFGSVSEALRRQIGEAIDEAAPMLADRFYERLLVDERASRFLDHALVNRRLRASLAQWVRRLFAPGVDAPTAIADQRRVGEVHARIGVSIDLVSQGARTLRRGIGERLATLALPHGELVSAVHYVHELIDVALDTMNAAYEHNAARMARNDEAYRLIFLNQDLKAERERQRSELLEWAQRILMRYYWEPSASGGAADDFHHSQFGLWLQHKASLLFEGAPEIDSIQAHIAVIESQLLPELGQLRESPDGARPVVAAINQRVDAIKSLLGVMFDRFIEAEDGRDTATRLLNQRYVPSVLKREIELARRHGTTFSLILVVVDRFEALRDIGGMDAADAAVARAAEVINEFVGAGDFAFRIGEDQFLAVIVEAGEREAEAAAQALRSRIGDDPVRLPRGISTSLTVSVGTATFDGHPDYQHLIDRARDDWRSRRQTGGDEALSALRA